MGFTATQVQTPNGKISWSLVQTPRFNEFLMFNKDHCYIYDYKKGVVDFKSLERIYGNLYFTAIESDQKIKVFYYKGSKESYKERIEKLLDKIVAQYFRINQECPGLRVFSLGYVPSLFTVDFSKDDFADAVRNDFLKYGCYAYDENENLLGKIYNKGLSSFNVDEFKQARFLSFDFSKWIMKERKKAWKQLKEETKNL